MSGVGCRGPLASGVSGTAFVSCGSILPDVSRTSVLHDIKGELDAKPSLSFQNRLFELRKEILLNAKEATIQFNFACTGFIHYSGENVFRLFHHNGPGNFVRVASILTHLFSCGSSHVTSLDLKAHPQIYPRYLSNPIHLVIMADAVLFIQKTHLDQTLGGLRERRLRWTWQGNSAPLPD